MAQIVTITNPLTGQPAQVDQLEHTAQEIDDAIARALPGGAIDITLQKKAEGGYGYGGDSIGYQFTGDSDGSKFDNAINAFLAEKKAGIFQIKFQSNPYLSTVGCVGTLWTFGDGKYAVLKGVSYFGEIVQRTRYDGVWSPWEWVNPPMKLGVEYRTTERYLGKPVYRKMVWGGPLPNTGYSDVHIASECIIVQAVCYATSATSASEFTPSTIGDVIPWNNNDNNGVNMNAFKNCVTLWCTIDRSSKNFVANLWYIKNTD